MAIYLDNQTRPVLKRLLEKRLEASPKDFVSDRLLAMVIADEGHLQTIEDCEHVEGEYTGKKKCCSKCGGFFKKGHGIWWSKI